MNQKNCEKCKKQYSKPSTCSKKEWLKRKYCSHSCSNSINSLGKLFVGFKGDKNPKWKGGQIILVCKECKGFFKVNIGRKETAHFCSQICAHKNRDEGRTPRNERVRKSAAYKAWRTLVFERDNYTCQECKIRGGQLHADHIKPFAFYPELQLEVSNGRTLCVPCHKKTPTYGVRPYKNLLLTNY